MKKLFLFVALISITLSVLAQKADFKSAEKFRSANMSAKVGDMSVRANWINETDKFWYSYKGGYGDIYVDEIEEDGGKMISQVSVPVSLNGDVIGAMTLAVDVDKL